MKKFFTILLLCITLFSVAASVASEPSSSNSVLFKDIAIRVGNGTFLWDDNFDMGLHLLGGMTFGLTKRLEVALEAITPVVPLPFSSVVAGFEFSYALLGDRVSAINNAGTGLNTLISVGLFFSSYNDSESFKPTFLTLRINPVTIGSPYSGKREHILPMGVAWNFVDNSVSLFCSIILYDHYL